MDNRGAAALKVILIIAAVLVTIVFAFFGQLYFAGFVGIVAIAMLVITLFSRAKTPTD